MSETPNRCPAVDPQTGLQCGDYEGHYPREHTVLAPTGAPWFGQSGGGDEQVSEVTGDAEMRELRTLLNDLGNAEVQIYACFRLRSEGLRTDAHYNRRCAARDKIVADIVQRFSARQQGPATPSP